MHALAYIERELTLRKLLLVCSALDRRARVDVCSEDFIKLGVGGECV